MTAPVEPQPRRAGLRPAIFDDPERLTLQRLKRRGWTYEGVRRLLGEPDERVPNPLGADCPPLRLYRRERVERAEDTPAFHEQRGWHERFPPARPTGTMKTVAQREAEEIRRQARERAEQGRWQLPVLSARALDQQVREAHLRRTGRALTLPVNSKGMQRHTVNHLRHTCSPYERSLTVRTSTLRTKRAESEERAVILQVILSAIAHAYPHLRRECTRKLRSTGETQLLAYRDLPAELREQIRADPGTTP